MLKNVLVTSELSPGSNLFENKKREIRLICYFVQTNRQNDQFCYFVSKNMLQGSLWCFRVLKNFGVRVLATIAKCREKDGFLLNTT